VKERTHKRVAGFNGGGKAVFFHEGINEGGVAELVGVGEGVEEGVKDERGGRAAETVGEQRRFEEGVKRGFA